jgi:uncharacterized protein (DUF2461 family)
MPFSPDALKFLRGLARKNNKEWFEAHRDDYESEVREPMRDLIGEMNARFAKFAPEMAGDPKRSMFRINRDIRFSKDKSPYKTHAACWFNHRRASAKVGSEMAGSTTAPSSSESRADSPRSTRRRAGSSTSRSRLAGCSRIRT